MKIIVWSKENCSHCIQTKAFLDSKGIQYEERKIGQDWTVEELFQVVPTAKTVPQIFIDGEYIGGYHELVNILQPTKE